MEKSILVVGATGLLGEPVARRLSRDGYAVRLMVRAPALEAAKARFGGHFEMIGTVISASDAEEERTRTSTREQRVESRRPEVTHARFRRRSVHWCLNRVVRAFFRLGVCRPVPACATGEAPESVSSAGKMYWADNATVKIQRANLNGTSVEDLITTGIGGPWGIALD